MDLNTPGAVYSDNWQCVEDRKERKRTQNRIIKRKSRQHRKHTHFSDRSGADLNAGGAQAVDIGYRPEDLLGMSRTAQHAVSSDERTTTVDLSFDTSAEPYFDISSAIQRFPTHDSQNNMKENASSFETIISEQPMNHYNTLFLPNPSQTSPSVSSQAPSMCQMDRFWESFELNQSPFRGNDQDSAAGSKATMSHGWSEKSWEPNYSPWFQPLPQVQRTAPPSSNFAHIQTRLEHMVKAAEHVGFRTLDPIITAYYTATLDETTALGRAQSSSRSRHFGPLIRTVHENSHTWKQDESQGFKAELLRIAEDLYIDELRSLMDSPRAGNQRYFNEPGAFIPYFSSSEGSEELERHYQDLAPALWSLIFELLKATGVPSARILPTAVALLDILSNRTS